MNRTRIFAAALAIVAQGWQDQDLHFGMSEEPEQVLPQQRRTALVRQHLPGFQ